MDQKAYSHQLERLQEEQQRALKDTDDRIRQWHTFRSDYEALSSRLKTLPEKVTHDVMVPFGKMGFMPGQLIHTNEIMVLLGDDWFVERSAHQARELVDRRIDAIDIELEDLDKQRKLLVPRQEFTSELQDLAGDDGEMQDIREEYDEEKERRWKEEHKKRVREHKQKQQKIPASQGSKVKQKMGSEVKQPSEVRVEAHSTPGEITDDQLWARLDELERIETEKRELQNVGITERSTNNTDSRFTPDMMLVEDDGATSSDEVSSYPSSEPLDSDDYKEEEVIHGGTVIQFSHSQIEEKPTSTDAKVPSAKDHGAIATPADIYTKFHVPGPSSILKKKKSESSEKKVEQKKKLSGKKVRKPVVGFDVESDEEDTRPVPLTQHPSLHPAFTGSVVEKSELPAPTQVAAQKPVSKFKSRSANQRPQSTSLANQNIQSMESMTLNETGASQEDNTRPVSKFKAQRQKQSK